MSFLNIQKKGKREGSKGNRRFPLAVILTNSRKGVDHENHKNS
jgi:hypothetical protein